MSYPRDIGHCLCHHIPNIVFDDENNPTEEELIKGLNYLNKNKINLIKGDLIIFNKHDGKKNKGTKIFDGENILNLDNEPDHYGTLPKIFKVIEDNVPIHYWTDFDNDKSERGIAHNYIVWFDHTKVLDQCLNNIIYARVEGNVYAIYTHFKYNNKNYRIVYDHIDDTYNYLNKDTLEIPYNMIDNLKNKFKHQISKTNTPITFTTNAEYFYEHLPKESTLYLKSDD